MKKYVSLVSLIFLSVLALAQTLPGNVAYTTEQIVNEKVNKVNQQNQMGATPGADYSLFNNSQSSHGMNFSSVGKSQQVGLDLHSEAETLLGQVVTEQKEAGVSDPKGCSDRSSLSEYHNNICTASDTLQVMGIEAIETQSTFQETATRSYQTMEDTSAFPLDGSNLGTFAADVHGVPVNTNPLYSSNKQSIDSLNQLYKSLDSTSQYKGLKYSTKNDYFYLEGKKYPTSVLYSKDAMLKAGISKSLTNFVYSMLNKKALSAQSKITKILKDRKLYDGKNWSIIKSADGSDGIVADGSVAEPVILSPEKSTQTGSGVVDLSSSLVEDKTLFKDINGMSVGLSSDDIFKMVSRKYREKDKLGFFHNSSKK
jgi:hypothetical protein